MNFSIAKGEFCVLLGPSGSGKSTLLNIIGGIDGADSGYISIDGDKLEDMDEKALTNYDMKDIRLSGGPARNKVDKKLIKDVKKSMNECRGVDIYIIVSGDHGYSTLIKELRSNGKKVIVIGRKNNTYNTI